MILRCPIIAITPSPLDSLRLEPRQKSDIPPYEYQYAENANAGEGDDQGCIGPHV